MLRKVRGKDGRNRFLWDCQWLVLRADMRWDRWSFVHENIDRCKAYFDNRPSWVRAFRIWRLLHQVHAFTQHPDLKKARDHWYEKMKELDEGELSEKDAACNDQMTRLDMGLSAGELKRIRKMCVCKPNWRFNPNATRMKAQVDNRLNA